MKSSHENGRPHLETEIGLKISRTEYHLLKSVLPSLGFAFQKKSRITDFVVPTKGKTTRRMRIERILRSADGETGLHCVRTFKNHPIKGKKGKHVRGENEKRVTPGKALLFIVSRLERRGKPIPYYSKKRWHFQGTYQGYDLTIALDHAFGLGKYAGFYMEIETILPARSSRKKVRQALKALRKLARKLVGEKRRAKISYRRMLMRTWAKTQKRARIKKNKKNIRKAKKRYTRLLKKLAA